MSTPAPIRERAASGTGRGRHRAIVVAGAGWAAAVGGAAIGVMTLVATPIRLPENEFHLSEPGVVAVAILGTTWATVGAVLVLRVPGNAVGWWVLLVGIGHGLSLLGGAATGILLALGAAWFEAGRWAGWLTGLAVLLGSGVFYLALIFPTGRGHTRGWDLVARMVLAMIAVIAAIALTRPGPLHLFPHIANAIAIGPPLPVPIGDLSSATVLFGTLLFSPIVVAAMVSRYRAGTHVERAQLRWFVSAIVLTLVTLVAMGLATASRSGLGDAPIVAFGIAGCLVPVAIGIAILRYRLYEIDRIVSRTIAWSLTTGLLLIVFATLVLVISTALGSATNSTFAVAASTLVAAAMFQPLRGRLQQAVDRRFNRSHLNASQTVDRFVERLRDEVTIDAVTADLGGTVDSAMQPASQVLWLRTATARHGTTGS